MTELFIRFKISIEIYHTILREEDNLFFFILSLLLYPLMILILMSNPVLYMNRMLENENHIITNDNLNIEYIDRLLNIKNILNKKNKKFIYYFIYNNDDYLEVELYNYEVSNFEDKIGIVALNEDEFNETVYSKVYSEKWTINYAIEYLGLDSFEDKKEFRNKCKQYALKREMMPKYKISSVYDRKKDNNDEIYND